MKKIVMICLAVTVLFAGCTKDFDTLRQNPNSLKNVSAGTLLSETLYRTVTTNLATAKGVGNELMQYTVQKSELAYVQRYFLRPTDGNNLWSKHYLYLNNVQDMLNKAKAENNKNYIAIALTLKSYMFSMLTDAFGNIPYSEALKGDSLNFLPKYDKQQDIYPHLLADLDSAAVTFDESKALIAGGDILYGTQSTTANQIKCWKKFCNSLRLRLYLRVSNRPEMNSIQKIKEIVGDATKYPIFTSNTDQACLSFTNVDPFTNPYFSTTNVDFGANYCPSFYVLQMLQDFSDPRIGAWYNKNGTEYVGVASGFPSGMAATIFGLPTSYLLYDLHTTPKLGMMMSYAEVQFILAEAALKGWVGSTADAATYYQNGIQSSMDFWGVTMPSGYMAQPGVAFDNQLSTVMKQKYLSLFFVDLQAWFEYRRTGLPALTINPQASNNAKMPNRLLYPTTTQTYNKTNYQEAVNWMGGDDINYKAWWQ